MNPARFTGPAGQAADLFEELHWGIPARKQTRVRVPHVGPALAELGRLEAIEYATNKRGDGPSTYRHEFGEDGGRKPRLAVAMGGRRDLHIVGGSYRVKGKGIVD